jgi:hydrogenase expression/formation protein HypE
MSRRVTLAHGNGGRLTRELIESVFVPYLADPDLRVDLDAAPVPSPGPGESLYFTTDGFTVQPLEFPGGDIGSLAVHGTVNDLAVSGARPAYLALNVFIEEGLDWAQLERIVASLGRAAQQAGVRVVTGDTKVVPRGQGSGLYLATSGIGLRRAGLQLDPNAVQVGDRLVVSGPIGDHGTAVMLAREEFGLKGDLASDSANVWPLAEAALQHTGLRFMRDPTRGGVATVAHELASAAGHEVRLAEAAVPRRDAVVSVCEILGYDPYYLACEGRIIAVCAPEAAEALCQDWQGRPGGAGAAVIGVVGSATRPRVVLETELGGERLLEPLEEDPLPRIC